MKTFLPDVNVWLALASQRHTHASACSKWLQSIGAHRIAFCRITQMGLLRLLTHESVMGRDVLSSRNAWQVYRAMLADERIDFAGEPLDLEQAWKKITMQDRPTPKIWTDAYLVAFARTLEMRLVTLDSGVLSMASDALLLLEPANRYPTN
ncbi:MAG TPA: TA system VapC family ribonuclease toxin [Bryobacteraceae bacterium]|nr:TA system VapC family ribonuclease toxin [Bryobacteraceae bacterium]